MVNPSMLYTALLGVILAAQIILLIHALLRRTQARSNWLLLGIVPLIGLTIIQLIPETLYSAALSANAVIWLGALVAYTLYATATTHAAHGLGRAKPRLASQLQH